MSFPHESRKISVVEPKGVYCYSVKAGTNRPAGLGSKRLCFGCETTAIHCKCNFSARNVKSALFESNKPNKLNPTTPSIRKYVHKSKCNACDCPGELVLMFSS